MKKPNDIKKFCPVCHEFSFSLTKKNCDFCKANLWDLKNFDKSSTSGYTFTSQSRFIEIKFYENKYNKK